MAKKRIRKTIFTVDEDLCTGCEECTASCVMQILQVVDGLCMTKDPLRCVECGVCSRKCPQKAISFQASVGDDDEAFIQAGELSDINIDFAPLTRVLWKMMEKEMSPVQIFEYENENIREFDDFEIEGESCYTRLFQIDKMEKSCVSLTNFCGMLSAQVVCLTPADNYDIPTFCVDWTEGEEAIFFLCDFFPGDDPGRNMEYLEKYYYTPLDEVYQKYVGVHGLEANPFHWMRAIGSPYVLTGNIDKSRPGDMEMMFDCAIDYFKAWLKIWREATPKDPQSDDMKLVAERRKTARFLSCENDPAGGALDKFMDSEKAHAMMKLAMP